MNTDEITPFRERLRIACKWQFTKKTAAKYYFHLLPSHLLESTWNSIKGVAFGLVALLSLLLLPAALVWLLLSYFVSPFWHAIFTRKEKVWSQLRRVVDDPERRRNHQPIAWSVR